MKAVADMAQRTCSVDGCDSPVKARYFCNRHYKKRRRDGLLDKLPTAGPCAIERCENPASKRGWCLRHYLRWRNHGDAAAEVADRIHGPSICVVCERPTVSGRYCSNSCRGLAFNNPGRPKSTECITCGAWIDLTRRMPDGRLRYPSYTARCDSCVATSRPHRYGMTAEQIADRDGAACRWCGRDVDFTLVGTRSKWAPSVDHIIPWSRGGTSDEYNLQLLHRICNARKGTQVPA